MLKWQRPADRLLAHPVRYCLRRASGYSDYHPSAWRGLPTDSYNAGACPPLPVMLPIQHALFLDLRADRGLAPSRQKVGMVQRQRGTGRLFAIRCHAGPADLTELGPSSA